MSRKENSAEGAGDVSAKNEEKLSFPYFVYAPASFLGFVRGCLLVIKIINMYAVARGEYFHRKQIETPSVGRFINGIKGEVSKSVAKENRNIVTRSIAHVRLGTIFRDQEYTRLSKRGEFIISLQTHEHTFLGDGGSGEDKCFRGAMTIGYACLFMHRVLVCGFCRRVHVVRRACTQMYVCVCVDVCVCSYLYSAAQEYVRARNCKEATLYIKCLHW